MPWTISPVKAIRYLTIDRATSGEGLRVTMEEVTEEIRQRWRAG